MPKENSLELLRHLLGSVDLSDIKRGDLPEGERKEYCAAISAAYPILEKDIKVFLYEQLMYASNQAETWERVIFGRGTYNGMALLLEHWKKAHQEHLAASRPKEKFDETNPLPEI